MKREILFKGKRVDNGEWVYGYLLSCREKELFYITEGIGANGIEVIPETVSQFTGILDVEGNKIFENDMLEFPFDLGQAYVFYDGIRFAVKSEGSEAIDYEPLEVLKQCKIIGNIHEQ